MPRSGCFILFQGRKRAVSFFASTHFRRFASSEGEGFSSSLSFLGEASSFFSSGFLPSSGFFESSAFASGGGFVSSGIDHSSTFAHHRPRSQRHHAWNVPWSSPSLFPRIFA